MMSLRVRLFVLVAAITIVVWAGAAAWTALSTRAEIQRVLDGRLIEAARMVAALNMPMAPTPRRLAPTTYTRQLSCQIWSMGGRLIGQSAGAPDQPLATGGAGFSERRIGDQHWRVYTHVDAERGVRVVTADVAESDRVVRHEPERLADVLVPLAAEGAVQRAESASAYPA